MTEPNKKILSSPPPTGIVGRVVSEQIRLEALLREEEVQIAIAPTHEKRDYHVQRYNALDDDYFRAVGRYFHPRDELE